MNEKKNWSVEAHKDGKRHCVRVREVENGFVCCITQEGQNLNGEWEYSEREYISKTNPLANASALKNLEKEDEAKMKGAVQSLKLLL